MVCSNTVTVNKPTSVEISISYCIAGVICYKAMLEGNQQSDASKINTIFVVFKIVITS